MSTFKSLLGFGTEGKKGAAQSSSQTSTAVSAEHQGPQPAAAQKASSMVPATLAERDEAAEDTTVCVREAEVSRPLLYSRVVSPILRRCLAMLAMSSLTSANSC